MLSKFYLPQGRWEISSVDGNGENIISDTASKVTLLIAGGRRPATGWLKLTHEKIADCVETVAVDKGIDYCSIAKLQADFCVGDGDSADKKLWEEAASYGKVFSFPANKDRTDLQLAIEKLDKESSWIFTGILGGRLDHLLSVIETVKAAAEKYNKFIMLADEKEVAVVVPEGYRIDYYPPEGETPIAVSLLAGKENSVVSIEGVKWPLEKAEIKGSLPYAISNVMTEAESSKEMPRVRFTNHKGVTVFYVAG